MPQPIAYSYVRFSSKKQAGGSSLHRQTQDTVAGESPESWCRRNKVALDTSLTFRDLGRSAFQGRKQAELEAFLVLVESGRIRPGSFLLVEKVDRISRKGLDEGSDLLKRILKRGVSIVTLSNGRVYGPDAVKGLMKGWLELQMHLEAAHEYSLSLSGRVKAAWEGMRKKARNGVLVSAKMPPWLAAAGTGDGRRAVVVPEKVAIVQRIFGMAVRGYGITRIVHNLADTRTPPLAGRRHWCRITVRRLLADRSVLGEYQPTKEAGGRRVKDGPPVERYYPAVVTEATFHQARAALGSRKNHNVPRESEMTNVFSGLLRDAAASTPDNPVSYVVAMRVEKKREPHGGKLVRVGEGRRHHVLQSARDTGKKGSMAASFPFEVFETALLAALQEVDPRDLLPPGQEADEVVTLAGELAAKEARIAETEAALDEGKVEAGLRYLRKLEAEKEVLAAQLAEARLRAADPLAERWAETKGLLEALATAPDPADARLRLKAALRRTVEAIWLLVVPRGRDRLAAVQVRFAAGAPEGRGQREVVIWYRPPRSNQHHQVPGWFRVASLRSPFGVFNPESPAWTGLVPFDLGRPGGAERVEEILSLSDDDLEALFRGCEKRPLP